MPAVSANRFQRMGEEDRPRISLSIDGRPATAREGDTLLVAILTNAGSVRDSEFGDGACAGFCLMGACQDCWVWTASCERLRACTTMAIEGMDILTKFQEDAWPVRA